MKVWCRLKGFVCGVCDMICKEEKDIRALTGVHCERPPLLDGKYILLTPKYMGMWIGAYSSPKPAIKTFVGETCTTAYVMPEKILKYASENISGAPKSYQAKYFEQGVLYRDGQCLDLHTVIWEVNVSGSKIWWTYGQKYLLPDIEIPKEIEITTAEYWLKETKGWNRHCKFWLGYDCCLSQHFVKWHKEV